MEAFKERLVEELSELNSKTNKLFVFINNGNDTFEKMESIDRQLLRQQYHCMVAYEHCLATRIERLFTDEDVEEMSKNFNTVLKETLSTLNNETI